MLNSTCRISKYTKPARRYVYRWEWAWRISCHPDSRKELLKTEANI